MQASQDRELSAVSGARQVPLLTRDQLRVGSILTGPAWSSVRKVIEIEGGGVVGLIKVPATPQLPGHLHIMSLYRETECACGYRRENVTGLLPAREGAVKTYLLEAIREMEEVDQQTVYANSTGILLTPRAGVWELARVPVIPMLLPVWTMPQALRRVED